MLLFLRSFLHAPLASLAFSGGRSQAQAEIRLECSKVDGNCRNRGSTNLISNPAISYRDYTCYLCNWDLITSRKRGLSAFWASLSSLSVIILYSRAVISSPGAR